MTARRHHGSGCIAGSHDAKLLCSCIFGQQCIDLLKGTKSPLWMLRKRSQTVKTCQFFYIFSRKKTQLNSKSIFSRPHPASQDSDVGTPPESRPQKHCADLVTGLCASVLRRISLQLTWKIAEKSPNFEQHTLASTATRMLSSLFSSSFQECLTLKQIKTGCLCECSSQTLKSHH